MPVLRDNAVSLSSRHVLLAGLACLGVGACNDDSSATDSMASSETGDGDGDNTGDGDGDNTGDGDGDDPEPVCGDGQVGGDERCDDGNTVDLDGCNSDCHITGEKQWEITVALDGYEAAEPEAMIVTDQQILLAGTLRQNGDRVGGFVSSWNFEGESEWVEVIPGENSSVLSATLTDDGTIVALTPGFEPRLFGISLTGELLWQSDVPSTKYVTATGSELITVTGAGESLGARYTSMGLPAGAAFAVDAVGLDAALIGLSSGAWVVGGVDEQDIAYVASYGSDDTTQWRTDLPEARLRQLGLDSQGSLWAGNNNADIINGQGQLVKLGSDGSVQTSLAIAGYVSTLGVDATDHVVSCEEGIGVDAMLVKRNTNGDSVWSQPVDGDDQNTTLYQLGFRPSNQQIMALGSISGGIRVLRSLNR